ncbi:SagB family peptide dehydrogenase [Desulfosarcina sp.]|uniref:SagB family peptide dehydrogenase n=1 Tax=Desulfosarcina sp. TaxID=2027861 RepID=UPI003970D559
MIPEAISAAHYHRATSYRRNQLTPHTLDWVHQPKTAKDYAQLARVPLNRSEMLPATDYIELVKHGRIDNRRHSKPLDIGIISTLFRLTHDVTARSLNSDPPFFYRSVASAGALYPFELYLAVHHIDGLDAGVYHHNLFDYSLTRLRRGQIPEIPPVDRNVAATFCITGIFFRSAWKYRSRAYRYVLLDAGHLLENLRLALVAMDLAFSIHLDFDDLGIEALLGLDPQREGCLACVHLHDAHGPKKTTTAVGLLKPLTEDILRASTVSGKEVTYPDIIGVHRAGQKISTRFTEANPALNVLVNQPASWIDLGPQEFQGPADYVRLLRQRRSRRNFVPASGSRAGLVTFLGLMAGSMGAASKMPQASRSVLVTGLLLGAGLSAPPGFYLLDPDARQLGRVCGGRLTAPMAAACLDQMWLKHAALHVLFMTDLAALERTWGARGYRYAMIEAGRLGQQAYLAATAVGWGVCGIGAIYDREAAGLLDLSDDGALLYLVGAGPVKST